MPARTSMLDLAGALSRAPVLGALDPGDQAQLLQSARVVKLVARQVLWRHGRRADFLGLVLTGRLKLTREQTRRELIVDVAGAGELMGEVSLSLNAAYQFNVICLRRAEVLLVPARELRALLERNPTAAVALAMDLAQQLLRLTRRVEALGAGDVEHRLARVMLGLADRFGAEFPGGVLVPIKLGRHDLASLAATTLESTIRRLSDWKRRGIVTPQPVGYLVRDLAALRQLAD